jgi:hypothetical protein
MMTSFAFIAGLVPLVIATGAGMLSRRGVGTAVFGGMLAASLIGIFLIPLLYVVFQWLREKVKGSVLSPPVPECDSDTEDVAASDPDARRLPVDQTRSAAARLQTH